MATSQQLDEQLRHIAWTLARSGQRVTRPAEPWDLDEPSTIDERREGCLELLRVYTQMLKVIERRLDLTVKKALTLEANYGDIAVACGVSRQAARQRWLRHRDRYEPPTAKLAGGPGDGEVVRVRPYEELVYTLWEEGPARPSGHATYAPSPKNPTVYEYKNSTKYDWDQTANRTSDGLIRVYQLAKECAVDSRVVMAKMAEMGELVRSASSTIKPSIEVRLREELLT